jgi:predicted amidohydrolase
VRFGLAQIRYRWGESRSWEEGTTDNLEKAVEFIRRAGREGAAVVAFSEYFLGNVKPMPIPCPITERLSQAAREANVYVICGATRELVPKPKGSRKAPKPRICSFVIAPNGKIVSKHYKQVFYPTERGLYDPGPNRPTTIHGVKVGILGGYELLVPEIARRLAKAGAEILVVQMVASSDMPYMLETMQSAVRARTMELLMPVLAVGQYGEFYGGIMMQGGSIAYVPELGKFQGKWAPNGARLVTRMGEYENLLPVDIAPETAREVRKKFSWW